MDSGLIDQVWDLTWSLCCVLLLFTQNLSPNIQLQVQMSYSKLSGKPDEMLGDITMWWNSIPHTGGISNTPTHFMLWKPCMISSAAWANLLEYKREIESALFQKIGNSHPPLNSSGVQSENWFMPYTAVPFNSNSLAFNLACLTRLCYSVKIFNIYKSMIGL